MVLIDDLLRGKYVRKAIREQRATIQDPFVLRQGGFGFVVRNPIFDGETFLGLAIAVIDVPVIVKEVFHESMHEKYSLELIDSQGNSFYSNSTPDPPREKRLVPIGDTTWSLRLSYRNYEALPPIAGRILYYFLGVGFLLSLLLIILILNSRNEYLNREVARQTEELRRSEDHFRSVVEKTRAGYFLLDKAGNLMKVNDAWMQMHSCGLREKIPGHPFIQYVADSDREKFLEIYRRILQGEDVSSLEYSSLSSDGGAGYRLATVRTVYREGRISGIEGFLFDITERKKAEKEKDVLMQELNHRVKNNLLMISSLVKLKNTTLPDSIDLSDISHQIDAIRIIHEKLYRTGAITSLNLKDYIWDLLTTIFASFSAGAVRIETQVEDLFFSTKSTVSLGLLINEVATNAIKYGFIPGEEAVFTIKLWKNEDDQSCTLILSNNGRPFPENVDLQNPETLGLRLISILAEQIHGTVSLKKSPQTEFSILFPCDET